MLPVDILASLGARYGVLHLLWNECYAPIRPTVSPYRGFVDSSTAFFVRY